MQKKKREKNRECLLKILSNVRFLERQGLALRGDGDEKDGNFAYIMKLRGEDDAKLLDWLKRKTNQYTSADMHNEMLQVMALKILWEIAENVRNSTFFSIMADKMIDKSNREQVVIKTRPVYDDLVAHEELIGLCKVESLDAATLTEVIKDCLLRMNVSFKNAEDSVMTVQVTCQELNQE